MAVLSRFLPSKVGGLFTAAGLLVLALLTALYFYGPMLGSALVLIDDHEILRFLGADRRLSIPEIPALLQSSTEVGEWGQRSRLRPVYYALRMLETSLWGDDATLWFASRVVLLALIGGGFGALMLYLARGKTPGLGRAIGASFLAGIGTLLIVSMPAWTDIVRRLGPSEIYLGAGLVLFATGSYLVWGSPARSLGWVVLVLGFVIALGSKENAITLAVPLAGLFALRAGAARRWTVVVLGSLAAIAGLYISVGVGLGTVVGGGDVYGAGRSIARFIRLTFANPYLFLTALCFLVCVLIAPKALREAGSPPSRFAQVSFALSARPYALACGVFVYLVAAELFLYQNSFSSGFSPPRYGLVTEMVTLFACLVAVAAIADRVLRPDRLKLLAAVSVLFALAPVVGGFLPTAVTKYRTLSIETARYSQQIQAQIQSGVSDIMDRKAQALVLVDEPFDYERAYSLAYYLAFYANSTTIFLDVDVPDDSIPDAFTRGLVDELESAAKAGRGTNGWRVAAFSSLDRSAPLVCFAFGARPAVPEMCDSIHVIP